MKKPLLSMKVFIRKYINEGAREGEIIILCDLIC